VLLKTIIKGMNPMKKLALISLAFSAVMAMSAFAAETEVDFNSLVSAEEMNVSIPYAYDFDHHEDFRCFAEGERGHRFEAIAREPREAQERAMGECRRHSHECRPLGCHRV
jgi:hypothetical protein